ncbi:hypothetical protein LO762_26700 [Actinocorallia sp. API 0066]|uniref:hypothetical protein n=1 Tax=Actinocorallia sp. API 0066 TaxID=2896846 RepID=UPI001E2E9B0A|nr:hypothetical protein [Actinocorallia sp. API 0066]MCD0452744.1 hypothetical protein [Actinocorallia sp. API 0066]
MVEAWIPGAGRVHTGADGGALKGGAPRAVWSTSENDPDTVSARSAAQVLAASGAAAHVVWNPVRGELVQLLPATRAALLLGGDVGREGRACLQIAVVGTARTPFTHGPLLALDRLLAWLDAWGVHRRWPAGPPLAVPAAYEPAHGRRTWASGGHFGHSQVPGAGRPSPGGIDVRKLTGPDTFPAELPRPRLSTEQLGVLTARRAPRRLEAAGGV